MKTKCLDVLNVRKVGSGTDLLNQEPAANAPTLLMDVQNAQLVIGVPNVTEDYSQAI